MASHNDDYEPFTTAIDYLVRSPERTLHVIQSLAILTNLFPLPNGKAEDRAERDELIGDVLTDLIEQWVEVAEKERMLHRSLDTSDKTDIL